MCTFTEWTSSVYVLACLLVHGYVPSVCMCIEYVYVSWYLLTGIGKWIYHPYETNRNENHIENYCRLQCVLMTFYLSRSIDYVIQKFRLLSKWCATVCVSAYVWMVIWQLLISLHTWIASSQDLLGARNQTKKRGPHKELNESIHR